MYMLLLLLLTFGHRDQIHCPVINQCSHPDLILSRFFSRWLPVFDVATWWQNRFLDSRRSSPPTRWGWSQPGNWTRWNMRHTSHCSTISVPNKWIQLDWLTDTERQISKINRSRVKDLPIFWSENHIVLAFENICPSRICTPTFSLHFLPFSCIYTTVYPIYFIFFYFLVPHYFLIFSDLF